MLDQQEIQWIVRAAVLSAVKEKTGQSLAPVGISNRHIHLSEHELEVLFGKGYALTPMKPLSQPGQFASEETVTVVGPKGKIEKMRVLGPTRPETQVEISITDSFTLGLPVQIRMSGVLEGTPGCEIIGPAGSVKIPYGVIVAARHLHISKTQSDIYGLKTGDIVSLRVPGERAVIFENVLVRSGDGHELEVHIDVDEANAAHLKNGEFLEIIHA